ncbi:hypothetical protein [Limnohabitans sp. DM1]|uniref:hypothetical protein n=1 Tax=Limnohabitans sp. DM1 TaxID=1597955 RepID=UPI000B0383EC|nr:hypothetical protein [Limnohabitans sp. DM1]
MDKKTKMENELSFVQGNGMFPTVEVNLDSLEKAGKNFYLDEICEALKFKRTTKKQITVYLRESVSINFGDCCNSLFIGVAGPINALDVLFAHFRKIQDVQVRLGEFIPASHSKKMIHLEQDDIWKYEGDGVWMAINELESLGSAENNQEVETADDLQADDEYHADLEDEGDIAEIQKVTRPLRMRAARKTASVGTIRQTIETIFGLPEGSVQLCGPDKQPLRSDARIGTLRKRWE